MKGGTTKKTAPGPWGDERSTGKEVDPRFNSITGNGRPFTERGEELYRGSPNEKVSCEK